MSKQLNKENQEWVRCNKHPVMGLEDQTHIHTLDVKSKILELQQEIESRDKEILELKDKEKQTGIDAIESIIADGSIMKWIESGGNDYALSVNDLKNRVNQLKSE